ncbi:hypothetical protein Lfu02_59490 [Longispora fulva]|uniref:Uncharacterized protein (TIGR02246 family) n=1 Tax=Longispora fulva TaxID=619741 RepID=A0A8J7GQG5_9ACTN|nr:SgcJ/EcaC family oxidoreductase [Longispora fulva]MBG6137069.1 uncharacterized protein (TIGR02246 family) [Longispora fulva]GIG61577.1 hypothetical protein Lfu02_59490 [Longispora fulva]
MTNERAISDIWLTMATAWQLGDAAMYASVFAEHVDFVTIRGEERMGRAQVEASHAALFDVVYANTRLLPEVTLIRPVADGVCLVHALTTIVPLGIRTHAQAVVVIDAGRWSIAAFHTTLV